MIPKRLKIKNFLSHKESDINFDNFNVALILGSHSGDMESSNGGGKSSILEAVRWVLFDKARVKKKDSIVKRDAVSCRVEFEFEVDGQLYKIVRKRNKVVGESEVSFYRWNGDWEPIECDTNTATDEKILETINFNHDVFLNSVYFKQGDISIFTESSPAKRKDILKSLLKLDKWEEYQKETKKILTKLNTQLEEKQKYYLPIEKINTDLEEVNANISRIQQEIKQLNTEYLKSHKHFLDKKSELQFAENPDEQKRLSDLEVNIESLTAKKSSLEKKISAHRKTFEQNKQQLKKLNEMLIECVDKITAKNKININEKRQQLFGGKNKAKVLKDKIDQLSKSLDLNEKCEACLRPIKGKKEAEQIEHIRSEELKRMRDTYSVIMGKIKKYDVIFKDLENTYNAGVEAEITKSKVESKINILDAENKRIISDNKNWSKDLSNIDLKALEEELTNLQNILASSNISKLKQSVNSLSQNLSNMKKRIDALNVELGGQVSVKDELISTNEKQKSLHKEISELNEQISIYEGLKTHFGKDGIQAVIIDNVVEELENYTNETLAKICNEPTTINIVTQKQGEKGSWTETFDIEIKVGNVKDDIESFSGGESFRISFALRLAFSKILAKRMGGAVKFLLLDEVNSSLDIKGIDIFVNTIKALGNDMKILVISHDSIIKDRFENIIMVNKDSTGSSAFI